MACGFDSAREAIAANLNRRFGTDLKAGNLFLTCGAAPGLIAVIKALLAEEDSEIMVVAPFFPEYRPFTESNGGHLVVVPADTDAFQIDLDQVERRLTPRTQAIIINSPNNPSGVVYSAIAGAARSCGHVCPPTLIQLTIARCADELPDLAAYDENRQLLYRELTAMGYQCAKPDGAFYLFVKAPGGDDVAFCERAKREHNLLVVPGTGFECPGYVRLSYCVSNEMIRRSLPAFRELIAAYQS